MQPNETNHTAANPSSISPRGQSAGERAMWLALFQIQCIVHQKTAKTQPALHHFQSDFDAIRRICAETVGPYSRSAISKATGA